MKPAQRLLGPAVQDVMKPQLGLALSLLVGIRYNATMDERRYMPRAHLDEGGDQFTNRAVLLSSGQEHCQRINFHVLVSLAVHEQALNPTRRVQRRGTSVGEVRASWVPGQS